MKKLICIAIFPLFLLCGCGNGGSADVPSKVTYSDKVGKGTVENYTNVDWLYKNYLGEYGLPVELKPTFTPALKMLANGFALQLNRNDPKQGDDVKASIELFHKQFLQFVASGEAALYVKSMLEQPIQPTNPAMQPLTEAEQAEQMKSYVPPPMTDDAKKAVAEALAEEERVLAEVKKIATDYNLPYTINGQDAQWFIYSPSMKGGGKSSSGKGSGSSPTPNAHSIISWNWRMGDILWSNGSTGTGIPGHVGMVDSDTLRAVEANTGGVVIIPDLNTWANRYTQVRGYSPKLSWDKYALEHWWNYTFAYTDGSLRRKSALNFANSQAQSGKPYNWNFFNPRDTTKFYCSSLVWNAYVTYAGWNILGNYDLPYYAIVNPSDVTNSRTTTLINSSAL